MEYEDHRTIATPEGVQLNLPLAGLASRFMALLLDYVVTGIGFLIVSLAVLVPAGELAAEIVGAAALLAINVGYFTLFEVLGGGRTLGKRAARLRVVTTDGNAIGLRASLIRNIIRLLESGLLYLPAIVSILATRDNQRLGDLAAGTLVTRDAAAATVPSPPYVKPERYRSWDVTGVSEQDALAARAFLARRPELRPDARRALAGQLAERLRPRVAGAQQGLNDEPFLEHLVAAKADSTPTAERLTAPERAPGRGVG